MGMICPLLTRNNEYINEIAHGMAGAGSIAAVLCAICIFAEGIVTVRLFSGTWFGEVAVRLDYLGAWFLLILGLVGVAASVYAVGYCRQYSGRRLSLVSSAFNAFLLALVAVFTAHHVIFFLVAWEVMTLVSFLLVNIEWELPANRRAAYLYLVMTQVGTAFLIAAFLLLAANAGSFEFDQLRAVRFRDGESGLVFVLAFIGIATKAGLAPVHIWLPEAHPAAPSHVSALMSGVMLKAAVYAFCRFAIDFLPQLPLWCGVLVLLVAVTTCILGVLYALMENNLKRLLAYSSIENMGIIFLGLGAGLVFFSQGQTALAGLAWTAGLFHALNHALFKGLLFLAAGSVIQATHLKNMEKMGGLIKAMPLTAVGFAIGCVSIAALPPFNGFASEWMVFQSLFALPQAVTGLGGKLGSVLLMALLGLTGAMAAACFVKAFGIVFLAKPRTQQAVGAVEGSGWLTVPVFGLGLVCAAIGIWPASVLLPLVLLVRSMGWMEAAQLQPPGMVSSYSVSVNGTDLALTAAIGLIGLGLVAGLAFMRLGGPRQVSIGETWTCGIIPDARLEYTGTGFSKPIRVAFGSLLGFRHVKTVEPSESSSYYGQRISYEIGIRFLIVEKIYRPLNSRIIWGAKLIRRLQNGSLRLYIGYILAVTVIALVWNAR